MSIDEANFRYLITCQRLTGSMSQVKLAVLYYVVFIVVDSAIHLS